MTKEKKTVKKNRIKFLVNSHTYTYQYEVLERVFDVCMYEFVVRSNKKYSLICEKKTVSGFFYVTNVFETIQLL